MFSRTLSAATIVLATFAAPQARAENIPSAEAQAIAKDAYVYSYAMMESYQTWRTQAVDKAGA